MAKTSLKRMKTFIGMYGMQYVLSVRKCTKNEPGDRYLLGQVAAKGYQVTHKVGEDDYIYLCKTLTAAGECVNRIVFDLPMEDSVTPCE
jgi:hypothetical protein